MEIRFLNVDLVIDSSEDLQLLVNEFGENVSVMFNGEWEEGLNHLSLEIRDSYEKNADEVISELCFLVENLSSASELIWNRCSTRKFNIGFQSGDIPNSYETEIRVETIKKVATLGGSIVITIYPIRD